MMVLWDLDLPSASNDCVLLVEVQESKIAVEILLLSSVTLSVLTSLLKACP
jgi:hypothetical protein